MNPLEDLKIEELKAELSQLSADLKAVNLAKQEAVKKLKNSENYKKFISCKTQVINFTPYNDMKKYEELYKLSDEQLKVRELEDDVRNIRFSYEAIKRQIADVTAPIEE